MKTITLATFNDRSAAEALKARLAEANVTAEIHRQHTMEKLWFVGKPLAAVRVDVREADYNTAAEVFARWDPQDAPARRAIHCPECGSSHIEFPQFTRKFLLPNFVGLLSALRLVEKEYYCQDCHHTWPPEGARPHRIRPHMAPYYFIEGVPEDEDHPPALKEQHHV
jgi:hypothetical protein